MYFAKNTHKYSLNDQYELWKQMSVTFGQHKYQLRYQSKDLNNDKIISSCTWYCLMYCIEHWSLIYFDLHFTEVFFQMVWLSTELSLVHLENSAIYVLTNFHLHIFITWPQLVHHFFTCRVPLIIYLPISITDPLAGSSVLYAAPSGTVIVERC